jgi:hypothetical protein
LKWLGGTLPGPKSKIKPTNYIRNKDHIGRWLLVYTIHQVAFYFLEAFFEQQMSKILRLFF